MRALLLALLLPAAAVGEDLPNFLRKVTDERDVQRSIEEVVSSIFE